MCLMLPYTGTMEHSPSCADVSDDDGAFAYCRGTSAPSTFTDYDGENIAISYGTASSAVSLWYDEYTDPGYDFAQDGGTSGTPTGNSDTGHFTQVVWAATTKVGCGMKTDCDFTSMPGFENSADWGLIAWVCQYNMAGNW